MWPSIAYSLRSYLKHEIAQGNELQKVSTVYNLKFCGQCINVFQHDEICGTFILAYSRRDKQNLSTYVFAIYVKNISCNPSIIKG